MGQDVEIRKTATIGEVLVMDTDRSFTGQDGQSIGPELKGHGVPLRLAERLFDLGLGIDHVFVLQNAVTVRRPGGWSDESAEVVTETTHSFLRFYPDDEITAAGEDGEAEELEPGPGSDSEGSTEEE